MGPFAGFRYARGPSRPQGWQGSGVFKESASPRPKSDLWGRGCGGGCVQGPAGPRVLCGHGLSQAPGWAGRPAPSSLPSHFPPPVTCARKVFQVSGLPERP